MDKTAQLAEEFERESFRIDQLIWDAMALRAGESVLFCGCSNNIAWIKRSVEIGVEVSVIANDAGIMNDLRGIPLSIVRGSTSMVPARDASYDAVVAFHYLHEIDPFFHANVVTELSRVSKRLIIVEPAPPADALGLRIAALYSRAKRELGQFENYHPIDYWRKLLSIVKSDVTYETFSFLRTPPRFAVRETVALIIAMMAAEEIPEPYLAELQMLAKRPDAQLLPQARYVIVGTAAGVALNASAGTDFRDNVAAPGVIVSPFVPPSITRTPLPPPVAAKTYSPAETAAELPPVTPAAPKPSAPDRDAIPAGVQSRIARNAFGLPLPDEPAGQAPVAPSIKGDDSNVGFGPASAADAASEFGWEWETPAAP